MPLANALDAVLDAQAYDYKIIFVDDGSVDDTYKILRHAQTKIRNLTIIRLKRNLGQTPAFSAGFSYATGDYIISMDGDLQNDPQDIPKLLEAIDGKYDAICGWRKHRQDSATKRFVSRAFNLIRYLIFRDPVHDTSCSLKIFPIRGGEITVTVTVKDARLPYFHALLARLQSWRNSRHSPSSNSRRNKVSKPLSDFQYLLDVALCSILVVLHPPTHNRAIRLIVRKFVKL